MVERDIAKNGVVLFAAVVGVVVVREEMTVLLLYECVVGETVMKLPLMSNTAKKRIIDEEDKRGDDRGGGGGEAAFSFPSPTANSNQPQLRLSPFLRPFLHRLLQSTQ